MKEDLQIKFRIFKLEIKILRDFKTRRAVYFEAIRANRDLFPGQRFFSASLMAYLGGFYCKRAQLFSNSTKMKWS